MKLLPVVLLGFATQFASAQLTVSPPSIIIPSVGPGTLFIGDAQGGHVNFKFVSSQTPGYFFVVPSSGTTPAMVQVGVNPAVIAPLQPGVLMSPQLDLRL